MLRVVISLIAAAVAGDAPPGDLVWSTSETLGRGVDRTFVVPGTRKGARYLFKARGVCQWEPIQFPVRFAWPPVVVQRRSTIFGIDFRVVFGANDPRLLAVGDGKPERSAIAFVADRDDVTVRIYDNWELPRGVDCTIDGIELVVAPRED